MKNQNCIYYNDIPKMREKNLDHLLTHPNL